jgi:hypothetical protein
MSSKKKKRVKQKFKLKQQLNSTRGKQDANQKFKNLEIKQQKPSVLLLKSTQ